MARYEEWINRAKSSLDLAKTKIINNIIYEDLCYQAQQAVEKALKGFLIFFEVEPEFTHNIEVLIKALKQYTDIPDYVKEAGKLTAYAVLTRYPGWYDEITKDKYEQAVKIAQECLEWVEKTIKRIEEQKINN
ncbi:MAG: HEPN domain-containing protein [Treponema sp.]|jgi:HEPN domain-containing protein|nr:HEPN domain-containing protein [Treponema sp.]